MQPLETLAKRLRQSSEALLLLAALKSLTTRKGGPLTSMQQGFLDKISSYQDVSLPRAATAAERSKLHAVAALHAMSHVIRCTAFSRGCEACSFAYHSGQRTVLANNDAIAGGSASSREIRDQGFTRPKVLVLVPFRANVLTWTSHFLRVSPSTQVENEKRLRSEFSLPEGTIDKLAEADALLRFPRDHVETFQGNIDDAFRLGIKTSRRSVKLFSEFYASDIIIASPLGLRKSIDTSGCARLNVATYILVDEARSDADFLASIEIVIADQLDVLLMQNWDHVQVRRGSDYRRDGLKLVQFVFSKLNAIPTDPHGCDFARVKPWYLGGKCALRRFGTFVMLTSRQGRLSATEHSALSFRHARNSSAR